MGTSLNPYLRILQTTAFPLHFEISNTLHFEISTSNTNPRLLLHLRAGTGLKGFATCEGVASLLVIVIETTMIVAVSVTLISSGEYYRNCPDQNNCHIEGKGVVAKAKAKAK